MCDTFSSEAGRYFKGQTIDILTFKPVKPGLSGGVSIAETLSGIAGVILCSILAYFTFDISIQSTVLISVFGFTGMLADSILGSALQTKYFRWGTRFC